MRVLLLLVVIATTLTACRREDVPMSVRRPQRTVTTTTSAAPPVDLKGKTIEFEAPLKPPVIEGCRTGSAIQEPSGVVSVQKEFTTTQTIYTTVRLKESPPGLVMSVRAVDEDGEPVALDSRNVNQATTITLALRPMRAGTYKHETYWGGNVVCEETITVVKR